MTALYSPPPLRELPPARRRQLACYLRGEIAQRPPRPSPRRLTLIAAAVLVVLAVAAGVLGTRGGTGTASAAEVRAKLAEGLELRRTVRGEFSVRTRDPGARPRGTRGCRNCLPQVPLPSRFLLHPDGSFASLTLPLDAARRRDIAYDATRHVETSFGFVADERGRPVYLRASNVDPALSPYVPDAHPHLGTWVQGALAESEPAVEEANFEGRRAWKLTVTFRPGESSYDSYGARVDVVVDRETGLVLQVVQYAYRTDRWTSIATVHELEIGVPTTRDDFTVPKPPRAVELAHDYGFRRVPVADAADTIGYRPLLPANTLGLELTDFAVAETSDFPFPGIPARRDAASARYGRGAQAFTVSTYRGPVTDLPQLVAGDTVRLMRGPLAGAPAYVSAVPLGPAVLAGFADGLLVRITAPSAEETIAVADSLRAAG